MKIMEIIISLHESSLLSLFHIQGGGTQVRSTEKKNFENKLCSCALKLTNWIGSIGSFVFFCLIFLSPLLRRETNTYFALISYLKELTSYK